MNEPEEGETFRPYDDKPHVFVSCPHGTIFGGHCPLCMDCHKSPEDPIHAREENA